MKSILSIVLLLAVLCGASAADAADAEAGWKKLLSGVRVGMRRDAVHKLLSRTFAADIPADPKLEAKLGKSLHTALYILDDDWCAAITFDWTGFTERNIPIWFSTSPSIRSSFHPNFSGAVPL